MMFERAQRESSCSRHAKAVWAERSASTQIAHLCLAASATEKEKGQKRDYVDGGRTRARQQQQHPCLVHLPQDRFKSLRIVKISLFFRCILDMDLGMNEDWEGGAGGWE
jgi:hypothetical protein